MDRLNLKDLLQKLKPQENDAPNEIRRKQYVLFAIISVFVIGVFLVVTRGIKTVSREKPQPSRAKKVVVGDLVSDQDTWAARMDEKVQKVMMERENERSRNELLEKRLKYLEDAVVAQNTVSQDPVKNSSLKEKAVDEIERSFNDQNSQAGDQTFQVEKPKVFKNGDNTSAVSREKIAHLTNNNSVEYRNARDYVVSGTHAKVVITQGVAVSTAAASQANPQPVMMRLIDSGNMPRAWKSKLKDAVVIGSCYGDLSSERALCRIHSLSYIETNGQTVEKSVEGWVVGEDGKTGVRGKVVDRAGAVAREAFLTGILSGMSNFLRFEAQSNVYPVTPFGKQNALSSGEALTGGAATGASNALDKLAEFSIKRAESMQPVIEVNSGRVVDIAFKKGFNLDPTVSKKYQMKSGDEK